MDGYLDDIRRYIRLTESSVSQVDDLQSPIDQPTHTPVITRDEILEDIGDVIFKFRSYGEPSGSPEYMRGVEEGLFLAANMLESLLERHARGAAE